MSEKIKTEELRDVLLMGVHADPGITSHLRTYGLTYQAKALTSSHKNWRNINQILEEHGTDEKTIVITKITEYNLFQSLLPHYEPLFLRMIELIPKFKSTSYIYDGALSGDFTCFKEDAWKEEWENEHDDRMISRLPPGLAEQYLRERKANSRDIDRWFNKHKLNGDKEQYRRTLQERVAAIQRAGIRLSPYRTWKDIRLSVIQFLTETKKGLILRLFLANERFLAGEFEKLINLFVDYLRKVESVQILVDQERTDRGQIIEFYSHDGSVDVDDLSGMLDKFSQFLQLCSIDIQQAMNMVGPTNLSTEKLNDIMTRYAKEARRLLLDVQQEKERKLLNLKHRLQAEVVDLETNSQSLVLTASLQEIDEGKKIDSLDLLRLAGFSSNGLTLVQSPTINITDSQIIGKATGIIAQELNGDIQYSEDDVQILQFLKQNATAVEFVELKSNLDVLKDESTSEPQRTTAWQKLRGFLSRHADKLGDLGIKVAERIIDKYVFGQP